MSILAPAEDDAVRWPRDLHIHLHQIVRDLKFDWAKVSEAVNLFLQTLPNHTDDIVVTPQTCRKQVNYILYNILRLFVIISIQYINKVCRWL